MNTTFTKVNKITWRGLLLAQAFAASSAPAQQTPPATTFLWQNSAYAFFISTNPINAAQYANSTNLIPQPSFQGAIQKMNSVTVTITKP
jgi:hypothetical protein